MEYNDMVKEAYEEIIGFEKEAGAKEIAKGIGEAYTAKDLRDAITRTRNTRKLNYPLGKEQVGRIAKGLGKSTAAYAPALLAAGLGAKALCDHHKSKKQEEEQAEKAAAYYEEAQLAKEAAEADYAEACAYEDAALAILDELGYLD